MLQSIILANGSGPLRNLAYTYDAVLCFKGSQQLIAPGVVFASEQYRQNAGL